MHCVTGKFSVVHAQRMAVGLVEKAPSRLWARPAGSMRVLRSRVASAAFECAMSMYHVLVDTTLRFVVACLFGRVVPELLLSPEVSDDWNLTGNRESKSYQSYGGAGICGGQVGTLLIT